MQGTQEVDREALSGDEVGLESAKAVIRNVFLGRPDFRHGDKPGPSRWPGTPDSQSTAKNPTDAAHEVSTFFQIEAPLALTALNLVLVLNRFIAT